MSSIPTASTSTLKLGQRRVDVVANAVSNKRKIRICGEKSKEAESAMTMPDKRYLMFRQF